MVKDCRDLLVSLSPQHVKFRFVKRSANKVAHYLPGKNYFIADCIWRVGDVHSEFYQVLFNDLSDE